MADRINKASMDENEEISIEELFQDLCEGQNKYITINDLKKWDYLQDLIKDEEISEKKILNFFSQVLLFVICRSIMCL
jgi:hypothetical protein